MDIEFKEVTLRNLKLLGVEKKKNIYTLIEIHRVTGDVTVYDGYFDVNNDGSYKFEVDNDTIDFMHDLEYFDYFYCLKDDYENYIGGVLREKAYGWVNLNKRLVGTTGEAKWVSDTLKPFDRVIVRDAAGKWKCAIYSHRNSSGAFVTTDSAYTQCLPYDDETAHLVGTKDDYDGKYGSYYNE